MSETLTEFVASTAGRLDRSSAVIRGVKILGRQSKNNRTYTREALSSAVRLYEGAKVNVNHAARNPNGPRDYRDRIGVMRNVSLRGDGLYGDFHYNPKHALAEQLAWDAEHSPGNVGFSHVVQARISRTGGKPVVEAILHVQSVDLVADPATTGGLFESTDQRQAMIDRVASSLCLSPYIVGGLRGLEHCHTEEEICDYLTSLKAHLIESGHLSADKPKLAPPDRGVVPMDGRQFAEAVSDGLAYRRGGRRSDRSKGSDARQFTEAIGGPVIPNGFVKSIT